MNFDMSQFDNLELEELGQWPIAAKAALTFFMSIIVLVISYNLFVSDKINHLSAATKQENKLKEEYRFKYHTSANLEKFQKQIDEAETLFAQQLKSLPNSHETPGLLDDITFVGTTSNLDFATLNWQPEIAKEIYIELPIDIEVVGGYHDFGDFVSKIAGLPRIVTVHNFTITPLKNNELSLKLQAKTYRYREAEVQGAK